MNKRLLSLTELERFCHLMGRALGGGLSFLDAVESYGRTAKWDASAVSASVRNGESAADSLRNAGGFPTLLISMVEVGEASGRLDETFLRLADYFRELIRSRRAFKQGIVWPILQLIAALVVLSLLFIGLEYLQRTVTSVVAPDLFGFGFQPLGNLALVWIVAASLSALLTVVVLAMRRGSLPRPLSKLVFALPWVGTTSTRISTSRFAWALGAAIDSGTDAVSSIRLAVGGSGERKFRAVEPAMIDAVRNGESLESALNATASFPAELVQAVAVGESTGQVTEFVQRLADDYDEQNAIALRRFGQVCGLVVSLGVVSLLGFTIISMYSNYLQMVTGALQANSQTLDQIRGDVLAGTTSADQVSGALGSSAGAANNELIQTRDRMVKDFVENNEDFKKVESIYTTIGRFHEMTPNEFLDAIGGETPAQKAVREGKEMRGKTSRDKAR